jgi:hypothetical protein
VPETHRRATLLVTAVDELFGIHTLRCCSTRGAYAPSAQNDELGVLQQPYLVQSERDGEHAIGAGGSRR